MRRWSFSLLLVGALLAACGGTTKVASSGTGGSTSTGSGSSHAAGSGGSRADGGCINPTVGEPSSSNDIACQPANPCCTGYEWACDSTSHTWQQLGLGCACITTTPFACGSLMCMDGSYCEDHSPGCLPNGAACTSGTQCCAGACSVGTCGGAPPDSGTFPDGYYCSPIPSSCLGAPNCACIEAMMPAGDPCSTKTGGTCTEDGAGHVTVHCPGI